MPGFKFDEPYPSDKELTKRSQRYPYKLAFFLKHGFHPHLFQFMFLTATTENNLTKQRHILAGRRGGKTLAKAWETATWCIEPRIFHWDTKGIDSDDPLWFWALGKNYKLIRPAYLTFQKVLRQCNLSSKEYKHNKSEMTFEFDNALLEFKSADDPDSLRGAGLDELWVDESAFIPNRDAWDVVYPSLADKDGLSSFTTTPDGRNWYYDEFFTEESINDPHMYVVQYRSADNPYLPKRVIEHYKARYHPLKFRQEFLASFDAMAGKDLSGDWLHYYSDADLPPRRDMEIYMGVDPAVGTTNGDRFVITVIGVHRTTGTVYLLEQNASRIPFPEQVDLIALYHQKYGPQVIGIESQAYQAVLAQQVARLTTLPPVMPMFAKGKKQDRIMAMSPLFKIAKVLISPKQKDFIDEWINYDGSMKKPSDDCLDSMEIALRTAGALLPIISDDPITQDNSLAGLDNKWRESLNKRDTYDEHMGSVW